MHTPRFSTLQQWLTWQENLHPKPIDLGLERLRIVLERLGLTHPSYSVIVVGGTNGKGSSAAFLEAILLASAYRVGTYTSPHLLRYNERIRINGTEISDTDLCQAFARIDAVRGDVSLTYFEFGTLAALQIFERVDIQVAVLEVGLGGRFDAVNVLDADAALVTCIGIDHTEWLGPDRNSIGFEKAGIYRRDRPAICADPKPPASLLKQANTIGARLYRVNKDYGYHCETRTWSWWSGEMQLKNLPLPFLYGEHQLNNAAAVLMTLMSLSSRLPIDHKAFCTGLTQACIAGRFQVIPGPVEWILDVAHNGHGAVALARCLKTRPCGGRTHAVLAMLGDKDATAVALALNQVVNSWYTVTLPGPRGRSGERLACDLKATGIEAIRYFASIDEACEAANREATPGDRVVVFGSFYAVAQVLKTHFGAGTRPLGNTSRGLIYG